MSFLRHDHHNRRRDRPRRQHRRRKSWEYGDSAITIRVFSRRSSRAYHEIVVCGPRESGRFARLIGEQVRDYPRDPLVIAINGYQPWLQDILGSCIEDYWTDIAGLDRQVQFARTMQFPQRASKRGQNVPWTFIMDHMNVPQVYYWSVGMDSPTVDDGGPPDIDSYRFRVGAWECGRGACRFDREVPVAMVFTRPTPMAEYAVTQLLFSYLHKDGDFDQPREDEEGICWLFSRLYWLFTDWQNIISEVGIRLEEAESNSHARRLPVKTRTHMLHKEVDRSYELKEYLHFHLRAFKKLQKLKDDVPKHEQKDPLWADMDDAVEDLDQYESTLDSLKERFNNLVELEFNITSVVQSDNSAYLNIVATLFLPLSYLASIWGFSTVTWIPIWYLYVAIPTLALSIAFALGFPVVFRKVQKRLYPIGHLHMPLQPRNFTMLGNELPDSVDVGHRQGRVRAKAQRVSSLDGARSRSRLRGEKVTEE